MDIRRYWELPPTEQAAIRALVLLPDTPRKRRRTKVEMIAYRPVDHSPLARYHNAQLQASRARELLHCLGDVENVDDRSDADCVETAELLGFEWRDSEWGPVE